MVSPGLPPDGGGIGSYTDKTARVLAGRGHEVHVLVPGVARLRSETVDSVHIHRIPTPSLQPRVLARAWGVARALRRISSDTDAALRESGLLTRDSRMKERKKYGRRAARRSFQFSKR